MRHYVLALVLSSMALVSSQPRGASLVRGLRRLDGDNGGGMGGMENGKAESKDDVKDDKFEAAMEAELAMNGTAFLNATNATMVVQQDQAFFSEAGGDLDDMDEDMDDDEAVEVGK